MNISVTSSKISSIVVKEVESTPVYDIEVPKYHNFTLSNGLVLHNSQNTKDMSDSLAGALYNASLYKPSYIDLYDEDYDIIDEINTDNYIDTPSLGVESLLDHKSSNDNTNKSTNEVFIPGEVNESARVDTSVMTKDDLLENNPNIRIIHPNESSKLRTSSSNMLIW